jgi:hypothetical protein
MSTRPWSGLEQPGSSQETTCEERPLDPSTIAQGQASSDAASEPRTQTGDPFDPFRCPRCSEPIGVYEPLAVAGEEGIRITSRAAEPGIDGREAIYFHRDCFENDPAAAETSRRRSAWRRASEQAPPA